MKKLLLLVLLILIGCSSPEPQNFQQLVLRDDLYYLKETNEVFNGPVFNIDGKSETYIKNGKFNGSYISYHDNGQIKEKFIYKNNLVHGDYISYFSNGQKMEEFFFKNGILEGNPKVYYNNGQIFQEFIFNKGSESSFSMYYPNGQKLTSFNFSGSIDFDSINKIEGLNILSKNHNKLVEYLYSDLSLDTLFEEFYSSWEYFYEDLIFTIMENSFLSLLSTNQTIPFYLDSGDSIFSLSNGEFGVINVISEYFTNDGKKMEQVDYYYKGKFVIRDEDEVSEETNQIRIKNGLTRMIKTIRYKDYNYNYHGPYIIFWGSGQQEIEYYIKDKEQSNFTIIFENGQRQEIDNINDKERKVVVYFTNGDVKEGLEVNRKWEGIVTYTYSNGVIEEQEYKDGVLIN